MPLLKDRKKLERIQNQMRNAHENLNLALAVLNSIQQQSYAKSTRLQIQKFMYISTKSSTIIEPGRESLNEPPLALNSSTAEFTQHIPPDSSTTTALSLQEGSEMADISVKHRQPRLEDSSELAVSIRTTIIQEACSEYCRCQCHARSCMGIPSWLTPIHGSRLFGD